MQNQSIPFNTTARSFKTRNTPLRRTRIIGRICLMTLATLVLSACPQAFTGGGSNGDSVATPKGSLMVSVANEQGAISPLTIDSNVNLDVDRYEILGQGPNDEDVITPTVLSGTRSFNGLVAGNWILTIHAYNSENFRIGRGTKAVEIREGESTAASIVVTALDGAGTLSLELSWPETDSQNVAVIASLSDHPDNKGTALTFAIDGTSAVYSGEWEAGSYILHIRLENNGEVVWKGNPRAVHIVSGAESHGAFRLVPGVDHDPSFDLGPLQLTIIGAIPDIPRVTIDNIEDIVNVGTTVIGAAVVLPSGEYTYRWYVGGEKLQGQRADTVSLTSVLTEGPNEITVLVLTEEGWISGTKTVQVVDPLSVPDPAESGKFRSRWDTRNTTPGSSVSNQVRLPLTLDGDYDFFIDWGDGSRVTRVRSATHGAATHTYQDPGVYEITVWGKIQGFGFMNSDDRNKLIEVMEWGPLNFGNDGGYFHGAENLRITAPDTPDLRGTTNFASAFEASGVEGLNTNLNAWDVSQVTNMSRLFYGAAFSGDISGWDVSNVTDMNSMFANVSSFNGDLSNWDVVNVTNMGGMFRGASSFDGDISGWDVSNATDMNSMFREAHSFDGDISEWDVSNVTDMNSMFREAGSFNGDLSGWDVSNVTDMGWMFRSASSFDGDISGWDVSNVESVAYMFWHSAFTGNLSSWNLQSIKDISGLFAEPSGAHFDNVSHWDVSGITSMQSLFSGSDFNGDISGWDVSNVTAMGWMFSNAESFSGDLSNWNVSNVTTMRAMFQGARSFTGDISGWDVSNVTDMGFMFSGAHSFNRDISGWCVTEILSEPSLFASGSALTSNNKPKWGTCP